MSCKRYVALCLAALLLVGSACGCGDNSEYSYKENAGEPAESLDTVTGVNAEEQFTERDMDTSISSGAVKIDLVDNGTASGAGFAVKGNTITVKKEGTYVLAGSLSNGRIVVDAGEQDKIHLILQGASITCQDQGALYVRQADKVFITLADGTQNTIASTADTTDGIEDNVDGAIYSKDDLTLNGSGALTVQGSHHGVVCKAELVVADGVYAVDAQDGHAIQAKKNARFADGTFTLNATKDGVHVENPDDENEGYLYVAGGAFTITSAGDGFSAATLLQVDGGSGTFTCGGGAANGKTHSEGFGGGFGGRNSGWNGGWNSGWNNTTTAEEESTSAKGMKGGTGLLLTGGLWTLDVADDGLHSNGDLNVNGGTLTIASGDDGLHADGLTVVQNGAITVTKSYEGIEGNAVEILGGVIRIVASDDGLNAAGGNDESGFGGGMRPDQFNENGSNSYIRIRGGKMDINAGGDGIDANHSLYVEGGETYVSGPTNSGNGPLDYGAAGEVTGGILVAVGAQGMAQGFTGAQGQGAALLNLNGSATGELVITDSHGKEVLRWTPEKTYASIAVTCPGLTKGETYTVTAAGKTQTFTLTDWVYGSSGGFGGFGGPGSGGGFDGGMGGRPGHK